MVTVASFGRAVLYLIGALLGLVIGLLFFLISLFRGSRALHADGVICRAEVIAKDGVVGPCLAGPALVRFSGALHKDGSPEQDILGFEIRMQREADNDVRIGDQDLLLASFESFAAIGKAKETTNVRDYLANTYSTVTRWLVPGIGPTVLHCRPAGPRTESTSARNAHLDADIAADRARMLLSANQIDVAEIRITERLPDDLRTLRTSMSRHGRDVRAVGLRNGMRVTVYPLSQLARRLRGG
jgi:hypothetical protein